MRTILVVDDEPCVLRALKTMFDRHGFVAMAVADGPAALAVLSAVKVDLVLLDYMMPGLDGVSVLQLLREDGDRGKAATPVAMYTAVGDPNVHAQARAAGADEVLVKPLPFEHLIAAVRRLAPEPGSGPPRETVH